MLEYFRDLIAYTGWADSEFFRVWKTVPGLHEDNDLRTRTNHSVTVQIAFLNAIQDQAYQFPTSEPALPELSELHDRSREAHAKWHDFIKDLTPVDLEKPIRISWFRSVPVQPTFGEAITQTVMHTQHHRAQNMARLRQSGSEKTIVDYVIWVIKGRPAAQWNL